VGAAIGAAMRGMRPVAEMQFIDFVSRGFDLLTNFAAKNRYRHGRRRADGPARPVRRRRARRPVPLSEPEMYFVKTPGSRSSPPPRRTTRRASSSPAIRDEDPVIFLEHKFLYRRVKDRIPRAATTRCRSARRRSGGPARTSPSSRTGPCSGPRSRPRPPWRERDRRRGPRPPHALPLDEEAVPRVGREDLEVHRPHEDTRTAGLGAEIAARSRRRPSSTSTARSCGVTAPDTPVPYSPPLEARVPAERARPTWPPRAVSRRIEPVSPGMLALSREGLQLW